MECAYVWVDVCVYMRVCIRTVYMWRSESNLEGLVPCVLQRSNSGLQVWWHSPLPTEPYCWYGSCFLFISFAYTEQENFSYLLIYKLHFSKWVLLILGRYKRLKPSVSLPSGPASSACLTWALSVSPCQLPGCWEGLLASVARTGLGKSVHRFCSWELKQGKAWSPDFLLILFDFQHLIVSSN